MAAPINIDAAHAFEVGPLVADVQKTFTQDVNDGGTTYEVWYKYTIAATERDYAVSVFAYGDFLTYLPQVQAWIDLPSVTPYPNAIDPAFLESAPYQGIFPKDHVYYFQITSETGDVSPAVLTLKFKRFKNVTSPVGAIFVNDETNGFPGSIIGSTGSALQLPQGISAGEGGAILNNGRILLGNDETGAFDLYDGQLGLLANVTGFVLATATGLVSSNKIDTFYVGDRNNPVPRVTAIDQDGVLGPTIWTLPAGALRGASGIAPSLDDTILYYHSGFVGTDAIKRWDLINDIALANLAPAIADYVAQHDILVLDDDTLLVGYHRIDTPFDYLVQHYADDGTVLNTYTFPEATRKTFDNRIAYALDDPTSFWAWVRLTASGASRFENIQVSDGAVLSSLDSAEFNQGHYDGAWSADAPLFGHSESCPFFLLRESIPGSPVPLLIDNSVPCCAPVCGCPAPGGAPGATGPLAQPVSMNWYRSCTGGGEVPIAVDALDDEDWADITPPKRPDSWLTWFPSASSGSPGDPAVKWGLKPLSDPGRFVEGRLEEVSTIERGSSDKDGHYPPARLRIVATDADGIMRTRMADAVLKNMLHKEARYDVLSYAGRKAVGSPLLTPRPVIQGRIADVQPTLDRKTVIEIQDIVGSAFGVLDPEKTIGLVVGSEHPNLPEASKGRIYNIITGEHSDAGATDQNGLSVAKGVLPVVDCGDSFTAGAVVDPEGRTFDLNLGLVTDRSGVNVTGAGDIDYPTTVIVAPIIGGVIGPPTAIGGYLNPNGNGAGGPAVAHAHREVWMDISGGADDYIAWFFTNPAFDPVTNPAGDPNVRYKIISGTPSYPAFPVRPGSPAVWDFYVDFAGLTDGAPWGVQSTSPPQNLVAVVNGTPGTTEYVFAMASVTALGESRPSVPIVVSNGPSVLDATNNITINAEAPLDNPASVVSYRVLGRLASEPVNHLTVISAGSPIGYTDNGNDPELPFNVGTGGAMASENVWAWMACALGEVDVHQIYGSDLAEGTEPTRVLLDLTLGDIDGPYTLDFGGITQTGFWARGPRLKHHRQGAVTFAWNGCGYKDGSDLLIDQAFRMLLLLLNEFVEKNDGEGYRSGAFGPIETFADGTPKFWTTKFEDAQDMTATWLGSGTLGYIGAIAICEPTALGEILRRFFVTFGGHLTTNHRGQMYPYLIDPAPAPLTGKLYAERREIARLTDHRFAYTEQENKITYRYQYDYDAQTFRNQPAPIQDDTSITDHGGAELGVFQTDIKDCFYGNDQTTMEDRWQRHLTLYAYPPRYVGWATNLEALPAQNGDPVRFASRREGIGASGETGTAGVVQATVTSVQPYEVIHTVRLLT